MDDAVLSLCGMSSLPVCGSEKDCCITPVPTVRFAHREYLAGGKFFDLLVGL